MATFSTSSSEYLTFSYENQIKTTKEAVFKIIKKETKETS